MRKRYPRTVLLLIIMLPPLLAIVTIFAASEWQLRQRREAPFDAAFVLPRSSDDVEAKRQAILVGCWEGCHGRTGEGLTLALPGGQRLTAPALSQVLRTYSDGELVRLLRYGVRRDGTTALMMPADTFYPMSDAHIGAIVGFLRRQPLAEEVPRERSISLVTRWQILRGQFPLSAREVDHHAPRWGVLPRHSAFERGRYIASTVCAECHAPDFNGDAWDGGPALAIVAGYDFVRFKHLLRTGEPPDRRDLGDMSQVAREAFVHFRDDELADLYVFLRERVDLAHDDVVTSAESPTVRSTP